MSTPVLYRLLTQAALPLTRLYLRKRARRQPAYLEHWDERYGACTYPAPVRPRLWLHAVSVGETNAARALIDAFFAACADSEVLLTCMTPTGREAGERIARAYPGRITQCYLPYDTAPLMGKFLDETRPVMGVVMETEVWPNMVSEANARGIPLVLANARESEKSARQAGRFAGVMRPAFAGFAAVLAQSREDAARLTALGARVVHVCGSVKFDVKPDPGQTARAEELKKRIGRPVILLASTREGEEKLFVDVLSRTSEKVAALLVPRHPQRFDEVFETVQATGLPILRRSNNEDFARAAPIDGPVILFGDTMGEMSFYCALADVTIMGGSFGPYGSQNLIEPAAAGSPVLVGPSGFNFAKAVADAVETGAAERVRDARDAWNTAIGWLNDGCLPERRRRALEFAHGYTGSSLRQMRYIGEIWENALRQRSQGDASHD